MAKIASRSRDRILWTNGGFKPKPSSTKFVLLYFSLLMLLLVGGGLIYVWSRIEVIQIGYEISNSIKAGRALTEENKRLRLEIATLKSYERIEKIAIEELKMAKPKPDQVIVIR